MHTDNPYQPPNSDVEQAETTSAEFTRAARALGKALLIYLPLDLLVVGLLLSGMEGDRASLLMIISAIEIVFGGALILYLLKSQTPHMGALYYILLIGFGIMTAPRIIVMMVFFRRFNEVAKKARRANASAKQLANEQV